MKWMVWYFILGLFVSGYLGYSLRKILTQEKPAPYSSEYVLGINFLLDNETDKAISILLKSLESSQNTAQAYITIGKLFRRHGETESAIRIHQHLVSHAKLDKKHHDEALLELAQDYLSSGMLDRAERFFLDLVEADVFLTEALKGLLEIYSQEKKWLQAIEMGTRLEKIDGKSQGCLIAHFHCELAQREKLKLNFQNALTHLQDALILDPLCVRASLLQGEIYFELGEYELSIESLKQVESQNADYLSLIIQLLADNYQKLGKPERLIQDLRKLLKQYPSLPVVFILLEPLCAWKGKAAASEMLMQYLMQYPTLRGLQSWVGLNLLIHSENPELKSDLKFIHEIVEKILNYEAHFKCQSCGFSGHLLFWHCPTCKTWGSIKPLF